MTNVSLRGKKILNEDRVGEECHLRQGAVESMLWNED